MSLNNIAKQQFMGRSASYSTHASRRGVNLLGWEEPEELSGEQRRDCLVAHDKQLQKEIASLPKNSRLRKQLGQHRAEIARRINELRPAKKAPGVQSYFIDVAREQLTRLEFDRWMQKAVEMMEREKAKSQ